MNPISFFEVLVGMIGVLMSIGYFPQAFRIWQKKSSADVSVSTYVILSLGTFVWVIYGVLIWDMTIIFGFSVGVIGSWLMLGLTLYYRNRPERS